MTRRIVLYVIVLGSLLIGTCLLYFYKGQVTSLAPASAPKVVQEQDIRFEIVDTPASRQQGLSGRTSLEPDYGMLFVFVDKDTYGFWMNDMLIPIDIIWVADDGTIVGIEESVAPDSYPNVFYAPEPVRYVLEMSAGNARSRGWQIGSKISLPI